MSVRVLSWVFDHSPVEHRGDLLVLLVLADHAHDDGSSAYPSVDKIARKARLTRRGAQLALRRLETGGAIRRSGTGPNGTTCYRIIESEATSQGALTSPGEPTTPAKPLHGANSDAPGGELSAPGGANSPSPEPSLLQPSKEPSSLSSPSGGEPVTSSEQHASSPEETSLAGTFPVGDRELARDLFAYWQKTCAHPQAKPTKDRLAKVRGRLHEGFTVEQIRQAIDGAARAPFVNDAGKRFDDLELICRNGSKLEDFIGRASANGNPVSKRAERTARRLASVQALTNGGSDA